MQLGHVVLSHALASRRHGCVVGSALLLPGDTWVTGSGGLLCDVHLLSSRLLQASPRSMQLRDLRSSCGQETLGSA